jgi:hypothetical protein
MSTPCLIRLLVKCGMVAALIFYASGNVTVAHAAELDSAKISICELDPGLVAEKLVPALESGLSKTLAVAQTCMDERALLGAVVVRKNLWRKQYTVNRGADGTATYEDPKQLEESICSLLRVVDREPCPRAPGRGEISVFLNPSNQTVEKVMKDWVNKNAGIYRSLSGRIRWSSLKGQEQFESLLYRGRVGGK